MSDNKEITQDKDIVTSDNKNESEPVSSVDELELLRNIVFGQAQKNLINQINTLRSDMESALKEQSQNFSQQLNDLKDNTHQQFIELDNKLQVVDSIHDDNESNLQSNINSLGAEHDAFAEMTKQNFKNAEQSLSNESTALTNSFNTQLEQLKSYLENVSSDLSSSKTDRKTLATLLATMATNLQDETL